MSSLTPLTFEFSYDEIEFTRSATCGPNEEVISGSTSFANSGVNVFWSGGTFTVSGTFHKVFSESTWKYIPTYDTEKDPPVDPIIVTTQSTDAVISEVPSAIYSFISGEHDTTLDHPITYTVNTKETIANQDSEGNTYYTYENHTYLIEHKVCNNWDIFKNQLVDLISRGSS